MTESVEVSGDAMNENDTPLLIVRLDSDSDSGTRISSNSSSSSSSSEKLKLASIPNTHVTLCSIGNGDGGSASINTKGTRPIANGNGNGVDESLEKEDSHDHEPNLEIETNFEAPVLNTTDAEQKQISVCEDNDVVLNQPENPEINLGTPNLDSSQPNVTPLEAVKPTLEKTISEINEAPELAFIEKKPIIPGFDNDDDDNNSCVSHETDFWKIVSGKTEEELSKEAEEEKEWLRCIEEEDRQIAEEGRLKNLLKEVAKNEAESGDDDCESDEELTPPVVTDPCLIFDPSKVPDTGVIQPEYREAMGFVDMTDINTIDSSNPAIDTAPDKTAHIQIATNSQKGNSTEAAAVEAEAEEEQIAEISVNESPKPKSIEELEAELVEEAKQAARTEPVMDEGQNVSSKPSLESEEAKTEIPANEFSIMTEPITVHETKVEDSISMIYKIGVRKKLATTGKLPALKAKSQSVKANTADAMDESMDKDAEELERLAMQELLSEAKRGAERAREIGPLGWQKSRIPSTNKRFLINTIRGTLHDPRDRQRRRSRSRSDDRRRSRSRERRRSKSRDRRRTESQSRDQRRSTSRSRERRRTRSRSRDRRRPRSRSRERSSSRGPNRSRRKRARSRSTSPDESGSRNSKKKSLSGGKTSAEHETEPEIPIEVKMTLVKPSKCSWSSDEDDLDLSTAQSDTKVNTVPVLEGEERPEQAEDAIIHISDQSDLSLGSTKLDHVLETSATVGQISPTGSTSSEHCRTFDALKDKNSAVSENVSSSVESAKTEKPSTELMPAASEGNPSLPVKNVEPPGEELVTGILVDQVTDFEMKTTLTKLDAIVEVKAIADLNELEPYSDPEDKLMDTACSGELLTGSEGYPPCNTKENSRNESETESKGANYNPLDELTRRKLDIVESALREIEENPEEPSLFSDHERQHKAKKKKHKEHKKHKHKHKSKHKKKKRRS